MPLYRRPVLVAGRPRPGAQWQWFKLLGHTGTAAWALCGRTDPPGLAGLGTGVRSVSLAASQARLTRTRTGWSQYQPELQVVGRCARLTRPCR